MRVVAVAVLLLLQQSVFPLFVDISSQRAMANEVVSDFPLVDLQGGEYPFARIIGRSEENQRNDERGIVVAVFLGTECPLVRLYAPRLEKMAREYADQGVLFVGINSNDQDDSSEVAAFAKEMGLTFAVYKDPGQRAADALGATRTPEAVVIDAAGTIRYRGRIDDQFVVGLQRSRAEHQELRQALEALVAGKSVPQSRTQPVGCLIGRVRAASARTAATVTYHEHIEPILQRRCVTCHRPGEIGPFAMTRYDEVAGWSEMILETVESERMPPWFASPEHGKFANDARLSAEEKNLIARWVAQGAPRGEGTAASPTTRFVDGWNMPEPDLVVPMSKRPFHVPSEGVIDYKHYYVDLNFTEDKWLVASEARPGNRSVVHHILVFLQTPGQAFRGAQILKGSLIAAYAPGMPGRRLSPGMAVRIPAGSKVIFQIHYTPNGTEQEDLSYLGLKFCEKSAVTNIVESGWAVNFFLNIPPGAANHPVKAFYAFKEDRLLFNLTPHMHLRGKSFRYTARYPDGSEEILLDVPRFDFNWQIEYEFDEPKLMPKGTMLVCDATFDNSPDNPANPDPGKRVTFGDQTWDEMMIGWFTSATLYGPNR